MKNWNMAFTLALVAMSGAASAASGCFSVCAGQEVVPIIFGEDGSVEFVHRDLSNVVMPLELPPVTFPTVDATVNPGTDGTVVPVPEPSTYALMLAGLGVVGFVARRRKGLPTV